MSRIHVSIMHSTCYGRSYSQCGSDGLKYDAFEILNNAFYSFTMNKGEFLAIIHNYLWFTS